ncbi:hypothetical protein CDAR_181341 [Caerostris darwini]|uniref:Uncharacterized protein n=1 Tax=Caerostris darwini TaxID=1538125 RepID=A0AAV4U400_9ARAC|nr:hypothetical protein CDAR_181341 [Caerostris darwini]
MAMFLLCLCLNAVRYHDDTTMYPYTLFHVTMFPMPFFINQFKTLVVKDLLPHLFSKHLSMDIFLLATASLMQLGIRCITPCYYPIYPCYHHHHAISYKYVKNTESHAVEYIYTVYPMAMSLAYHQVDVIRI